MQQKADAEPSRGGVETLPRTHWHRLERVWWPGREADVIDDLVVGPSGVHVVVDAPVYDQVGTETACLRAAEAAASIRSLLPVRYHSVVRAVLRLPAPEAGLPAVAEDRGGVLVASPEPFLHIIRHAPRRLSTGEVSRIGAHLDARLELVPPPAPDGGPQRWWSRWWHRLGRGHAEPDRTPDLTARHLVQWGPPHRSVGAATPFSRGCRTLQ